MSLEAVSDEGEQPGSAARGAVHDDGGPIFAQIAEQIENAIVDGSLAEDTQAPSTTELAAFHRINPATAAKGMNRLVADGLLHKRRGVGMFVSLGARERLIAQRRDRFVGSYLNPLAAEARKLGIRPAEVTAMIEKEMR